MGMKENPGTESQVSPGPQKGLSEGVLSFLLPLMTAGGPGSLYPILCVEPVCGRQLGDSEACSGHFRAFRSWAVMKHV